MFIWSSPRSDVAARRMPAAAIDVPLFVDVDADGRGDLARAAVALAAELGLHMLAHRPLEIDGTTEFATQLMLGGIERLMGGALASDGA